MKGIIVDRKGRHAVLLTGDGSFIKIRNKAHFIIGHEIEFQKPYLAGTGLAAKISSIAAVFLLALGLGCGVYSYTLPYSYVDLDINPSIELTANVFDIIIGTETFNEDGARLLKNHKVNFKKLDVGIEELVDSAIQQGYLKSRTENAVLLTIISKDEKKKEKLEKYMDNAAKKALENGKIESALVSQQTNSDKHDAAKDMGISPGKLTLIEKAMKEDPELQIEDLKNAPVKEIMKHIKDIRKEQKQEEKQEKNQNKNNGQQEKDSKKQDKQTGSENTRAKSQKSEDK